MAYLYQVRNGDDVLYESFARIKCVKFMTQEQFDSLHLRLWKLENNTWRIIAVKMGNNKLSWKQ